MPAAAGGALDMIGPHAAAQGAEDLEPAAYVENRPGANWIIGMDAVAKSAPDGYTLLFVASSGLSINPIVFQHAVRSVARSTLRWRRRRNGRSCCWPTTIYPSRRRPEFIAHLKANPGKLNHASNSATTISSPRCSNRWRKWTMSTSTTKAHRRRSNDTMAGVIQFCFTDFGSALPAIQGGKLKPLAVASPTRYSLFPDIPALADDLPGFAMDGGMILLAPGENTAGRASTS